MKSGKSLADVTDAHKSGSLIMTIFVRGAIGMLQPGSAQRDGVVNTVTENVSIPFVPVWITQKAVEFILEKVELGAFNDSFTETLSSQLLPCEARWFARTGSGPPDVTGTELNRAFCLHSGGVGDHEHICEARPPRTTGATLSI
jgi:hypothetical protein